MSANTNIPSSYSNATGDIVESEEEDEEYGEQELTESIVPPPLRAEDPRHPSWEDAVHPPTRHELHDGNGQNMELSEMTVPPPARPRERRDSLERALQRTSSSKSRRRKSRGSAVGATIADGRPFAEEMTGELPTRRKSLEEQEKGSQTQAYRPSPFATELVTLSYLVFFSLLGTLARLGVEAITLYPNTPVSSRVLWANLGGSFIMGFLAEDRRLFRHEWGSPDLNAPAATHGKVKKTIPLYIGLATGFCGSFTSFSSFIRDCFLALTNDLAGSSPTSAYQSEANIHSRNGGFSFLALMAILILHPAVSLAGLNTGAQLALVLQPVTPTIPVGLTRYFLDPVVVVLGYGCWLGAVLLSIWPPGNSVHWRYRAVFPLVFAPPGCLLRYYVSKHLNAVIPSFPLGTFAVNLFGTGILGMAFDLQHASSAGASSATACAVLQGIMEGFCGCLTTVSTWVAEINGLRRRHGWIYGLTSVGVGLGLMVIIMGSMGWTVGFKPPVCS
ncbi:uncharacterized protein PV06_07332 [Exophiala oligosperma]|uniref:Chromosome condensation protein n=1 Tax=Exophiala oligosperma TaxID=215243 RepID=A0A0D2AIZ8_9EURO|nr:uncharacterized protein PV06_07332 [Exophiala oligosperma]KIW40101.1 hypothetical protein PV06_07332 [Exophiala oligosperma]